MDAPGVLHKHAEHLLGLIQRSPNPVTFTEVWRQANLAKSTVSKYLKALEEQHFIDRVRDRRGPRAKYRPTTRGQQVDVARRQQDLRALIKFYADTIYLPETITWQLAALVTPRLDAFLTLPQSPELYLTLFYIYYNLTSTEELFLRRKEFCEFYRLKRVALEYHLDKILGCNLGFHHLSYLGADYFFHDTDALGVNLRRLADAAITQYLLQRQYGPVVEPADDALPAPASPPPFPLLDLATPVVEELVKKELVEGRIKDAFLLFVHKYLADRAIERGVPHELLPEIPVDEPSFLPGDVEDIRGFCPRCGNWVFPRAPTCARCRLPVAGTPLIFDCVQAQKLTRDYKAALLKDTVTCPKCSHVYLRAWHLPRCPKCESEAIFGENPEKKGD